MSERWRKFRMLAVRFIVWLTPSWLWRKFQLPAVVEASCFQLRENCLKDCLDELSKRFEVAFQQKGARLETEFEPSIPTFRFDYQKVQQAAANLLNNALYQALPSCTVTLRCLSRPSGAEVSLTGATEHDQKVFDNCPMSYCRPRNYQESLDQGLTIAKRLILAHGGRIWVEPSSTGSKFAFVLPMDASQQRSDKQSERWAQEMDAGYHALVVGNQPRRSHVRRLRQKRFGA